MSTVRSCFHRPLVEPLEQRRLLTALSIQTYDPTTGALIQPTEVINTDFNRDGFDDVILLVAQEHARRDQDYVAVVFGSDNPPMSIEVRHSGVLDEQGASRGITIGNGDIRIYDIDLGSLKPPDVTVEIGEINGVASPCRAGVILDVSNGSFTNSFRASLLSDFLTNSDDNETVVVAGLFETCPNQHFDFDGDGVNDYFYVESTTTIVDLNTAFTQESYALPGAGPNCCEETDYIDQQYRRHIDGIVDVNDDDLLDIVLGREYALLNNPAGFVLADDIESYSVPATLPTDVWIDFDESDRGEVRKEQFADLNGNGSDERLHFDFFDGTISVYLSESAKPIYEFPAPRSFHQHPAASLNLKDVNSDGILDAIIHSPGFFFRDAETNVFFGIGDGTFSEALKLPGVYVGSADLTRDDHHEFVVLQRSTPPWALGFGQPFVAIFHRNIPEASFQGDADRNGVVNYADLETLRQNFGRSVDVGYGDGDFDANGKVDFKDFLAIAGNFREVHGIETKLPGRSQR